MNRIGTTLPKPARAPSLPAAGDRCGTAMDLNRRIATSVGTLAIADHGAGRPVVLWPSLFSDHRLFDRVVGKLGSGWRTICIDGPGFGRSDPPPGDVQPSRYADAVSELLDELQIETAFFAGCSWGGQVGVHFGLRHPRRARGLLLMNTPVDPNLGQRSALVPATRWIGSTATFGRGVARSMISTTTRRDHPGRVDEFVSAMTSFDPAAASTTVRTVLTRSPGLVDLLPQVAVPTGVLLGAEDRLCPVQRLLPFARSVPGATVDIAAGCGHLAPIEVPNIVAGMLRKLVDRAPA